MKNYHSTKEGEQGRMAERRMFTKKITDSDQFTSMPPTTQSLYFHLCMGADDEGFSNNIRIALFNSHASMDDFNTLVNKRFIIPFDSGVIVIKHWKLHNYIQKDRFHASKFTEERSQLIIKENGTYTECIQNCIQDGYKMDTEVRLDKDRIDKDRLGECSTEVHEANHTHTLTEEEYISLTHIYPKKLVDAKCERAKKYQGCYNLEMIKKWCEEDNENFKQLKTEQYQSFPQNSYDYESLEKDLLAN